MTLLSQPATPLPAIAVVIAVWDRYCSMLAEAVASVRAQAGVAVELLVVDNASAVVLPELPADVRVIRLEERATAGAARNRALRDITAPTVLFLDADDVLLPEALSHLALVLAREPGAVAAVARRVLWDPLSGATRVNERSPRPAVLHLSRHRRAFAALTLRYDVFQLTGCALLRTDAVRDAGGFGDADLAEDWVLRSALAGRGRIVFDGQGVVRFRVAGDSLWYRDHSREDLEHAYADFRAHRLADPRLPRWARALMPLFAMAHRRDARRLTAAGSFRPRALALDHA